MLGSKISATCDLQGRGEIRLHHSQGLLVLRNIVRKRARNRVLQKPFIGDQTVTVDGFHAFRVKIHGNDAD
jgi:CHAD domain-containing protein